MATKRNVYNEDKANSVFAVKIRKLFEESGNTHGKLAEYIEKETGESVTRQAVGQWCNGNSCPNLKTVPIIAKFFGVSTDYLLTNTEIRSSDIKIKQVCEFTGLSERAIETILEARYSSPTEGDNSIFKGIDALLSTSLIAALALNCIQLLKNSSELSSLPLLSLETIMIASEKLNIDSGILFDYISSSVSCYKECKEIRDKENECDLGRYRISKLLEEICNCFDLRSQYRYYGKLDWMKTLSLSEEKIIELQGMRNNNSKAGD